MSQDIFNERSGTVTAMAIGTFFIAGLWTGGMIFIGATQKVIDLADW